MDDVQIRNSVDYQVYDQSLSWLGQHAPLKEKLLAYQLRWKGEQLSKSMRNRVVGFLGSAILGILIGTSFHGGLEIGIIVGGFAFGGVWWWKLHSDLLAAAERMQLHRRMSFFKFMQLLCSQLHRLEDGDSLVAILEQVANQIDEKEDRMYIYKLISIIGPHPKEFQAYIDFARDYGQTELAEQLMRSVYAMNGGAFDRTTTDSISEQVNANITKQSKNIMEFKNKRFNPVSTKLALVSLIIIIGDFVTLLISLITSINFNGIG